MITVNEAGKLGGKSKSEAKQNASRLNGKKGGRPKKINLIQNEAKPKTKSA